jgi:hypothetical protein
MSQHPFKLFFFIILAFSLPTAVFAQSDGPVDEEAGAPPPSREEFFIAPVAESLFYGRYNMAYGGGLALGYGTGISFGIKLVVMFGMESFLSTEVQFFLRCYFFGVKASTGPFIQINAGPVFFSESKPEFSGYGSISAGLTAGWRIPLGKHFFIEPFVRGGYPYLTGGGLSGGLRF